jgi:hypothetical protein
MIDHLPEPDPGKTGELRKEALWRCSLHLTELIQPIPTERFILLYVCHGFLLPVHGNAATLQAITALVGATPGNADLLYWEMAAQSALSCNHAFSGNLGPW